MTHAPLPLSLPSLTLVMPTIGWDETFQRCARAALAGLGPTDEALIVFDGTPPPAPAWLRCSGATLLCTHRRLGPGAARNLAARQATGDVLLFVDADVELHADAMARLRDRFAADAGLTALFGGYDDRPAAAGLVSRFRNLLHHHTHASHPGPATTFWAGCGAVRRAAFLAVGGFDADTYTSPSIEDIELGLRLSDRGARIVLDPSIQGTHHKRWTLRTMLSTDIRQRAIPWSRLLLRRRELPTTLNLSASARASAVASLLLPAGLLAILALPDQRLGGVMLFSCSLLVLLALNRPFHGLLRRRLGWWQACVGVGLHALYLSYSSLTYALVALTETCRPLIRRRDGSTPFAPRRTR